MPRWIRCQELAAPFSAEYWHMGETTIRLGSVTLRRVMGVNNALMTASDRREDEGTWRAYVGLMPGRGSFPDRRTGT